MISELAGIWGGKIILEFKNAREVKVYKPSMAGYGYFLELLNSTQCLIIITIT